MPKKIKYCTCKSKRKNNGKGRTQSRVQTADNNESDKEENKNEQTPDSEKDKSDESVYTPPEKKPKLELDKGSSVIEKDPETLQPTPLFDIPESDTDLKRDELSKEFLDNRRKLGTLSYRKKGPPSAIPSNPPPNQ